jgi:hypothetical protein
MLFLLIGFSLDLSVLPKTISKRCLENVQANLKLTETEICRRVMTAAPRQ